MKIEEEELNVFKLVWWKKTEKVPFYKFCFLGTVDSRVISHSREK